MAVLVNKQAPDFSAQAVINGEFQEITLSQFKGKKNVVLFFYPLDFTFVCPTELHAFQEKLGEFKSKNTEVLAVSIDSVHTHAAWLRTSQDDGGISGITYPVISDIHKSIARDYDVLHEDGVALRATFLIDKSGKVRHQTVNDLPLGRNIDEYLRLVDAVAFNEKHGEVCPANWKEGEKTMRPDREGLKNFFNS
jgi:peroxiredoxin (alkyl hydroperoxide reductase subunit C)